MAFYNGPGGAGDATADATSQAVIATQKAQEATVSASEAAGYASNAASSATNAANSATAAAASATGVGNSVALAADWATKTTGTVNGVEYSAKYYAQSTILFEGAASTSATNASNSASSASTSATNAANSASAASTSATNAASSATSASGSASTATTKASEAAASASAAATSASNAATSATNASNSASAASTSATNASNSASAASTSASNASTSATNAANSATAAQTAETNAETAETNALAAELSANNWATKTDGAVAGGEYSAKYHAQAAASSASTASSAATSAANAQSAAETARDQTLAAFDSFDDRYLGSKSTAPTVDNDGNALVAGALYFNTATNEMKVYDGSQWLNAYASLSGALLTTNNLSDLNNTATARANLNVPTRTGGDASGTWSIAITGNAGTVTNGVVTTGSYSDPSWITSLAYSKLSGAPTLGTAAAQDVGYFATAAQGTNADTAYGWGNHASAGYLTTTSAASTYQTISGMSSYLTTSTAASTYAPIASPTFTGTVTVVGVQQTRTATSSNAINLSNATYFTHTVSGATTFTVSNTASSGKVSAFVLDLTNGGSATITWWSGVKWVAGTAPTLTSSGRDSLGFFTHDGGTTWTGLVLGKDIK